MTVTTHLYDNEKDFKSFLDQLSIRDGSDCLVQLYSAESKQDFIVVHNLIKNQLEGATIVGALNSEFIYNGQIYSNHTLVVITKYDNVSFELISQGHGEFNEIGISKSLFNQPTLNSSIQLISTLDFTQTRVLLDSIKDIMPNTVISGGILNGPSSLFFNNSFHQTGYFGIVVYGNRLDIHTFNTSSIIPIGKEHTITKAIGNAIYSIDHIPAKEFYESYLGSSIGDDMDYFGYKFPLVILKNKTELPSTVTECEQEGCLISKIHAKSGDQISLGYGDINYYSNEFFVLKNYLPNIPCEYLASFSSKPRTVELLNHFNSGGFTIPIFGLLTDYEFMDNEGNAYITSESSSVIVTSSNPMSRVKIDDIDLRQSVDQSDKEQTVLLKLIENTSKELNTLNKSLENMVIEKTNELLDHYYTDELTKLPNLNRLSEMLVGDEIRALCLIDISSFININNFYGNTIGNKVLIELAKLITDFNISNHFTTFRVHSDIFAVTCSEGSYKLFCNRMRMLQTKIHKHCFVGNNHQIYINTTFALSNMALSLYENTSMTLQHAKAEKITYLIYNEKLKIEDSIISNLTWTNKIRSAINNDRIVPFYQPIYNNDNEAIDRFEVLMRLIDENNNVISPFQFLPIAKKAGLYNLLTKTIIAKAFEYFSDKPYKFSINLSADDITNPRTRTFILNQLMAFNHSENVIFEIVESESIENYDSIISFINEVKKHGAQIAIDDFGTGFSNFHYLFKLNVDCIKIDGSIIQSMSKDSSAEIVAETIVDFANKMGIYTVAEYVSDEDIFNKTKDMGIGFSQGYFVAKPASDIVM